MTRRTHAVGAVFAALAAVALAQDRPNPAALLAAQREAMATFAFMDGAWRGPATTIRASGDKHSTVQTERVGPLLGGSVKVIEGRSYDPDGTTTFNALAVISYDVATKKYSMRSYALGLSGDFPLQRTNDGFTWEINAGQTTVRFTAVVKDGTWTETGDRIETGREPIRFFEMRLTRIGDSEWPGAGAVAPK